jgi:hypothetical protein
MNSFRLSEGCEDRFEVGRDEVTGTGFFARSSFFLREGCWDLGLFDVRKWLF